MAENQSTRTQVETWEPISEFPGYEASSLGQIRSIDRIVTYRNGRKARYKGRILKQRSMSNEYMVIGIRVDGISAPQLVHRLVAAAFFGYIPDGDFVLHGNGIRSDNRVENLRIGDQFDNMKDMRDHGNNDRLNRESCPYGHAHAAWNNVASKAKLGRRNCLACSRARGRISRNPELKSRFQELSDSYFEGLKASAERESII